MFVKLIDRPQDVQLTLTADEALRLQNVLKAYMAIQKDGFGTGFVTQLLEALRNG